MDNPVKYTVGVDVGGTHVRFGLLTPSGELKNLKKRDRLSVLPDEEPAALGDALRDYIRACGADVGAVGIGIPGTLSRDCKSTLKVPNIPALTGLPYADMVSARAGVPVTLENDTVMLLNGDLHRLDLPPVGVILGVYIGTGLGSALFLDGKSLKGRNCLNELGHFPLPGKKESCTCGNIGCAENYVSGRWLQGLRAEKFPDTHISEMFSAMRGTEYLAEYVDTLSCLLAGCVNLLDPERLIVGGGLPAMKDYPREALDAAVREKCMKPEPANSLELVWSQDSDEIGALGAAWLARSIME